MTIQASGSGAGTRDGKTRPNLLRVFLGTADAVGETDEVVVLEANLDDATGQVVAQAVERLFEAGALDAFCTPITMKKGRPAVMVTVLADPASADKLERVLFEETPTFGVRRHSAQAAEAAPRVAAGRDAVRAGPHQDGPAGREDRLGGPGVRGLPPGGAGRGRAGPRGDRGGDRGLAGRSRQG